jgi:hypothetical protein
MCIVDAVERRPRERDDVPNRLEDNDAGEKAVLAEGRRESDADGSLYIGRPTPPGGVEADAADCRRCICAALAARPIVPGEKVPLFEGEMGVEGAVSGRERR